MDEKIEIVDELPEVPWDLQPYVYHIELDDDMIRALQAGRLVVTTVNDGEYTIVIKAKLG